jgi:hypothetical protein
MADKNHVPKLVAGDEGNDVIDMRVKVDVSTRSAGPLGKPTQRRSEGNMLTRTERVKHPLPTPSPVPCTVDEHERATHVRTDLVL